MERAARDARERRAPLELEERRRQVGRQPERDAWSGCQPDVDRRPALIAQRRPLHPAPGAQCGQGQIQGANASLQGIANMIGPVLFAQMFAVAIRPGEGAQYPGAPFGLAALMLIVAMGIAWWATRPRPA